LIKKTRARAEHRGRRVELARGTPEMSPIQIAAARALRTNRVDATAAEVAIALREAGVYSLLLKGRTFARWLYADGEHRDYGDADLLVGPNQLSQAETVLAELGFVKHLDSADAPRHALHSHTWARRSDRAVVDLHWTLTGVGIPPDGLWRELARRSETEEVAGQELECLDVVGRAFHVALHAAHHGVRHSKPVEDLRRALARCDERTWVEAAMLARRLQATPAFGVGLRLLPVGAELADRLGVPPNSSVMVALFAEHPTLELAMGMQSLIDTRGARDKVEILRRALWPSPRFMRAAFPRARRGRTGLLLTYLGRPAWLLARVPGALAGVRRARRAVRRDLARGDEPPYDRPR